MKMLTAITISAGILTGTGCLVAPEYTPQQRKEMETKIVDGEKELVLQALISVFQDSGYTVAHTDAVTGVVNAQSGSKTTWWSGQTSAHTVTATVEPWGKGKSKARITFVRNTKGMSQNWYGGMQSVEDSQIISTPEMMQQVYADLEKEIFLRQSLNK